MERWLTWEMVPMVGDPRRNGPVIGNFFISEISNVIPTGNCFPLGDIFLTGFPWAPSAKHT